MKISIITATYNSGATVRDTLDSILRQDYADYEVIIKDGMSSDNTLDICREYEPRFEGRMRIISCADQGIYDAMNQGISATTGDIVGILNSDDFYTSDDVLSTIAKTFLAQPDIDAVYGDIHYVKPENINKCVRYYSSRVFRRSLMRLGFMPAHPSFYCKKSTYDRFILQNSENTPIVKANANSQNTPTPTAKANAYFDTSYKIAADFDSLLRMIYVGRIKTQYIPKDCVTMRMGGASSSGTESHKQINRDHLRSFKKNGVRSNLALLSLRYIYKVGEVAKGKF